MTKSWTCIRQKGELKGSQFQKPLPSAQDFMFAARTDL